MNDFESDWISLSQESEWSESIFWINLTEDKKVSESNMAVSESNMVEFKMAAIIKLSQHEWVKVFFVQKVGTNLGQFEWVWEGKLRWQNSRWLPSPSWVRLNEFESDWISLSQSQSGRRVFLSESERRKQGVWIQHGRIQDDCHHQVETEWMSEVFLIQHGRIQDGCHHQVESEWMSEGFFFLQMVGTNLGKCEWVWEEKLKWLNPIWLPSSSWVRMNEFESDWISLSQSQSGVRVFLSESERRKQGVWIQHGRIQDGCHHQVESEWISLSQIELVWVRIRVEWEYFWVNLREENKVSESNMAVSESNMVEFKMAAIIKLSQNEWVKVFFCVQKVGTNLGKCEWFWEEKLRWQNSRWLPSSSWVRMNEFESDWISLSQSLEQNGWIQDGRIQDGRILDGYHHQVEWEWMSLSQIELVWVRVLCKMAESKMAEFKMGAIIKLSENEWFWVRLN